MKKIYWIIFVVVIVFTILFGKKLWNEVTRKTFPIEFIKIKNEEELNKNLNSLEKNILENFKKIDIKDYNTKYYDIAENIRLILNSPNGIEVGSYILEKIIVSEKLSDKNTLYILNKLRVLKMRDKNLLESIRYTLEYIKLAKYLDSTYDIDRGKMGLSVIISSLNGYEISNDLLLEILSENRKYQDYNQVKILALLNLAENYIRLNDIKKTLETLEEIEKIRKVESEMYQNSLMIVVNSIYAQAYSSLGEKEKAYKYLEMAKNNLRTNKKSYFIDEYIYYSLAEELYNLNFNISNFSESNIKKILNSIEYKSDFRFLYYSYEFLFNYYKKIGDFEKYDNLKKEYDKKINEINEINYRILSLYMIESIENGIINRDYKNLLNRIIRMSLYIIILLIGISYSVRKMVVLYKTSTLDSLTKINNRKAFDKKLKNFEKKDFFMLIFDIDNFKKLNDTYGHKFGDSVLKKIGELLIKKEQEKEISAYRIGGEEFAVIILKNKNNIFEVTDTVEKIRKEIEGLIWIKDVNVTISGGLSYKCNKIYDECDKLLYLAKKSGKNKILNNFSKI